MDEKLMTEIFSEKQEVPEELKKRIHAELLKQEKAIYIRNIAASLIAVFVLSMFIISFAVIFFGDIATLILSVVFSVSCLCLISFNSFKQRQKRCELITILASFPFSFRAYLASSID